MGSFAETVSHGRGRQAVEGDRFLADNGWARFPRLVQWMVTGECSLRCPHCLANAGTVAPGLPWKEAISLVQQIAAMGVDELLLTGGEPLGRPDLPELIALLAANRIRWSLNTALMPTARQQAAMEKWPPVFVAVSLDGPPALHDRFRGAAGTFAQAMRSLQYFSELVPGRVAAGTTVTATNFRYLPETFGLVLESGASTWGLHLLVPEGRAAQHPELRLSRRQLKQLLAFAAAKRTYFPVTMADEIGYCGYWEPLVREAPFYCGAGKLQCVVLPDGEVVPCTTPDITESAGNIRTRSLREIWKNGFTEVRQWSPSGRCAQCAYAPACQGGCWLQRRHGTQCFRDLWHTPQALARTGAVFCLGLAAVGATPQPGRFGVGMPYPGPSVATTDARGMEVLQTAIIQWYAAEIGGGRGVPTREQLESSLRSSLPDDPGAQFFLRYINGSLPKGFEALADETAAALKTRQRSLCLVGLIWRVLTERCLDGTPPTQRTAAEKTALRRALTELGTTAESWRKEIFEQKLDPFLRRPSDYRYFFRSKAGPPPQVRLAENLAGKRGWTNPAITNSFLAAHPYAEDMNLELVGPPELFVLREGQRQPAGGKMRAFDLMLLPPSAEPVALTLKSASVTTSVKLPAATELAYGDLLRLVYEQNKEQLDALAARMGWNGESVPLALPALRERLRVWAAMPPGSSPPPEKATVRWLLADLYLF